MFAYSLLFHLRPTVFKSVKSVVFTNHSTSNFSHIQSLTNPFTTLNKNLVIDGINFFRDICRKFRDNWKAMHLTSMTNWITLLIPFKRWNLTSLDTTNTNKGCIQQVWNKRYFEGPNDDTQEAEHTENLLTDHLPSKQWGSLPVPWTPARGQSNKPKVWKIKTLPSSSPPPTHSQTPLKEEAWRPSTPLSPSSRPFKLNLNQ